MPTWCVINRNNDHAHLAFVLKTPIHLNAQSSWQARAYLKTIEQYLRHSFGGDPAYTGLITRNPVNPGTDCTLLRTDQTNAYTLDDLAAGMPTSFRVARTRERPVVIFGRNVWLFDETRYLAYQMANNSDPFSQVELIDVARSINSQLPNPLPDNEVINTANSIYGFVSETYNPKSVCPIKQADKGRKSGVARRKSNDDRNARIVADRQAGMTLTAIAEKHGISRGTVNRVLNEPNRISKHDRDAGIVDDWRAGMTKTAIAEKWRIGRHTVISVLNRARIAENGKN